MKKKVLITIVLFVITGVSLFVFISIRSVSVRFRNEKTFLPQGISDYYYNDSRGIDEYTVWGYRLNDKEKMKIDSIIQESLWEKAIINDAGNFEDISFYMEDIIIMDSTDLVYFTILHNGHICCIYNESKAFYYLITKTI